MFVMIDDNIFGQYITIGLIVAAVGIFIGVRLWIIFKK
jgi:hypothetical protein